MNTLLGKNLITRPPVIAIMGHIDHGKSTLLDYIRKTNIVDREAGGITQHISAYEVMREDKTGKKQRITFLDTPGHESFSAMRERGAELADICVLILSAEEGVKAQTLEAYKSIEKAGKPFIVAINKIDKPNANIEHCKQELAENGIYVESYGGTIPSVNISAKSGEGVDDLLDMMLLVAELAELRGDPAKNATGFVLETKLDPKIGPTVTLIIKDGELCVGDCVVVGDISAKIKKVENFLGQATEKATFSSPVRTFGFATLPQVGEPFASFANKKDAEKYLTARSVKAIVTAETSRENIVGQVEIPLVIKTDVAGTLEALEKEALKMETDKVKLKIVHQGVGAVSENDIKMAGTGGQAVVIGFNVKTDRAATDLAEKNGTAIITFDIIYKLSEWLAEEVAKRTPKETVEEELGQAKILKVFSQMRDKQIIGGQVTAGIIMKDKPAKILRRDEEIGRGHIVALQEQKIKTSQVAEGVQFGCEFDAKVQVAPGDVLVAFDSVIR